jgi:hypothetical protein
MRNFILILAVTIGVITVPVVDLSAQQISDYLIVDDINDFKASKNPSGGVGPGILARADHFFLDHADMNYRISYYDIATRNGAKVQVTQHEGVDSDRWLAHEAERDFRNYYGLPGDIYVVRTINNHLVLAAGVGGWVYRWLSGNKVVHIEYTDLQMTKPEPLAIIEAYLEKHPSTLAPLTSAELRTDENKTKWIKNEMERRLWLCDKWFLRYQEGKVELGETLRRVVNDHLDVFLNFRGKYYGIDSSDDKSALFGWMSANNSDAIKAKLEAYKQWWIENKDSPINLN